MERDIFTEVERASRRKVLLAWADVRRAPRE